MEVGKLYALKKFYWFFFTKKEDLEDIFVSCVTSVEIAEECCQHYNVLPDIHISFLNADSLVMFLDREPFNDETDFYKLLTPEGEVGWVMIPKWSMRYCIEQCGQGAVT
jgi:hypothetical protein